MRNIYITVACWLASVIVGQEVGWSVGVNHGYYVGVYLRRYPSHAWVHWNQKDICLSAGRDWKEKESGKWKRDCVGVHLTNNWWSCFRRTW